MGQARPRIAQDDWALCSSRAGGFGQWVTKWGRGSQGVSLGPSALVWLEMLGGGEEAKDRGTK